MKTTDALFAIALSASVFASTSAAIAQTTSNAQPQQSRATAPTPELPTILTEDPGITKRAVEWFERMQNGDIDRSQLDASFNQKVTPQIVAAAKTQLGALGQPLGVAFGGGLPKGAATVYRYVLTFKLGEVSEYIALNKDGKVSGLIFRP